MIKTVLVDDEKPALDELVYLLQAYDNIEISGAYTNPLAALEAIHRSPVDVVFLDISMPEMDGFMFAETLLKFTPSLLIVFATAYDEHAIQAFDIHAIDYILKPLIEGRLDRTIKRIEEQLKKQPIQHEPLQNLLSSTQKKYSKLPVWKNDRIYLVSTSDILFCTTTENETKIVTEKECFFTIESLSDLEQVLDPDAFFRCHRSFMIRLDAIYEVIPWFNNTYAVKFKGCNEEVPVSRRNIKTFKTLLHIK